MQEVFPLSQAILARRWEQSLLIFINFIHRLKFFIWDPVWWTLCIWRKRCNLCAFWQCCYLNLLRFNILDLKIIKKLDGNASRILKFEVVFWCYVFFQNTKIKFGRFSFGIQAGKQLIKNSFAFSFSSKHPRFYSQKSLFIHEFKIRRIFSEE